jgi:hypothetical protein
MQQPQQLDSALHVLRRLAAAGPDVGAAAAAAPQLRRMQVWLEQGNAPSSRQQFTALAAALAGAGTRRHQLARESG